MADDGEHQGEGRGFLPPEPAGSEPDLGPGSPETAAAGPGPPPEHAGWQPPQHSAPPPQAPQPPQQAGWTAPPPGWTPPPAQPAPWVYQPPPPSQPDNGSAVAGFVLSIVSATLLLISAGLSSIVSVVCAGLGIFYSVRGRRRVDRGESPKHRGLAQAGFITGIISLILSVLATAFWVVILILALNDEEFRNDFQDELENSGGNRFATAARIAAVLGRAAVSLTA